MSERRLRWKKGQDDVQHASMTRLLCEIQVSFASGASFGTEVDGISYGWCMSPSQCPESKQGVL